MNNVIFTGALIPAIFRGDKTQTRRIVNLPGDHADFTFQGLVTDPEAVNPKTGKLVRLKGLFAIFEDGNGNAAYYKSRYKPGDVLYVREAWCRFAGHLLFRADWSIDSVVTEAKKLPESDFKWRSPYHMPADLARLFLKIESVRVERVQEISEADAKAEGAATAYPYTDDSGKTVYAEDKNGTFKGGFSAIWDGLNARRGFGWDANPYTWAFAFERVEKPQESGGAE